MMTLSHQLTVSLRHKRTTMVADTEVELDTQIEPTEEVANTEEVEETAAEVETEDKPKYTPYEIKQFERAKLAEAKAKELEVELNALKNKPPVAEKQAGDHLTSYDTIALIDAKVTHREDIELVSEYARFKGIPVADALKSGVIKSELAERAETRRTAEVTNTSGSKRTTVKVSNDALLTNASQGKLPDNPEDLAKAYYAAKLSK